MSGAPALAATHHATCIAYHGRGLLIRGAAGSGKSTLALMLMAYGADLVADDRVVLSLARNIVIAAAPPAIQGAIEARGIGLLAAPAHAPAPIHAVVDLDQEEGERLPPARKTDLLGQSVPLLHHVKGPHFAPALLLFLKAGRWKEA